MIFPLETKDNFGMIVAQTAKQVIIQRIREAEKESILNEFKKRQGKYLADWFKEWKTEMFLWT